MRKVVGGMTNDEIPNDETANGRRAARHETQVGPWQLPPTVAGQDPDPRTVAIHRPTRNEPCSPTCIAKSSELRRHAIGIRHSFVIGYLVIRHFPVSSRPKNVPMPKTRTSSASPGARPRTSIYPSATGTATRTLPAPARYRGTASRCSLRSGENERCQGAACRRAASNGAVAWRAPPDL